jgi:hypothetical protein
VGVCIIWCLVLVIVSWTIFQTHNYLILWMLIKSFSFQTMVKHFVISSMCESNLLKCGSSKGSEVWNFNLYWQHTKLRNMAMI